ncbi:MAG: hypothetical protein ACRC3Y_18010 [Romboutsia sp.]|uniref:hypothetical protein n=1 Tax=Romboutsia sp. TaxID=1965302 RepID=UPI003F3DC66B
MENTLVFDIYAYIAIILSFFSIFLLIKKKYTIQTYLIYAGISILICLASIYSLAIIADELNISANSNLLNLATLDGIVIAIGLFLRYKKINISLTL